MSTVYRATDTRLDRPVAVKVMDPRLAADPAFRTRFEREARSAAGSTTRAVVGVHDQGTAAVGDEALAFLVMELVEGGTLRDVLTRAARWTYRPPSPSSNRCSPGSPKHIGAVWCTATSSRRTC